MQLTKKQRDIIQAALIFAYNCADTYNQSLADMHVPFSFSPDEVNVIAKLFGYDVARKKRVKSALPGKPPVFTLVSCDDWHGLYKDGKLVTLGHEVTLRELADSAGIKLDIVEADDDWLSRYGHLPKDLRQVKRA